jgi:hypothetical protein
MRACTGKPGGPADTAGTPRLTHHPRATVEDMRVGSHSNFPGQERVAQCGDGGYASGADRAGLEVEAAIIAGWPATIRAGGDTRRRRKRGKPELFRAGRDDQGEILGDTRRHWIGAATQQTHESADAYNTRVNSYNNTKDGS